MVQRVVYTETGREDVERILSEMGFGEYETNPMDTQKERKFEHLWAAVGDVKREPIEIYGARLIIDGNAPEKAKTRFFFMDMHNTNGKEVKEFCGLGKKVYKEILSKLENVVIYDPMKKVEF